VDYTTLSDDELMERLCSRDLGAFDALYDRYGDLVYSVALKVVGDTYVAEDITQDVFLRVWRRPEQFDLRRGKFITWLLSVARNRSIDERRSHGRRLRHEALPSVAEEESDVFPSGSDLDDPALATLLSDDRAAVRKALEVLPPEQKLAIQLAYFGGLTQQEIANRLGHPLGTVKTRIRLGMQKMRDALEERRAEERRI
jgi:RNA polymerase sigma-70 factor, ECF subfamily